MPRTLTLRSAALVAALTLAAIADRADAAGGLILVDKPPAEDYTLSIGPGVAGYPEAPGSSRTKVVPVPGIDFYSSLGAFAATDTGIGWNFSRRADLQGGVRLWPVFGRSDSRSRRRGLPDVGTRLGEGLFLNYAPLPFMTLQSSVLAGSAYKRDGVQVEGGATVGAPIGDRVLLGVTLGATWANGPHLRSYYGVTPQASATGGLPVYTPGSGWLDVNAQLNGELRIAERWKLSGQVVGARLVGDAAKSPVTESRHQTTFSLTLWYQLK
jgi:outer membrane scaffolding protein for murein synthesis (MipA/OmpV family)